jgi:hypothetical protein
MDLYVPQEEGVEPKLLIDWHDEADGRIKDHERFIKGLASTRSSFPLTRFCHEALKLVLEILMENEEENSKTKRARVPKDGCHPLTTWVIWRQAERPKYP